MKLKEFSPKNIAYVFKGTPTLSVSSQAGLFGLSKAAMKLMGLTEKSLIKFHQDEDDKGNWYIEAVKEDGFEIRVKENSGGGGAFNNAKMARELTGKEKGPTKYLIAGKPTMDGDRKFWGLIIRPDITV